MNTVECTEGSPQRNLNESTYIHTLTGERAISVGLFYLTSITHTHRHKKTERDLPLHNMSTYADMSWDVTNWLI